MVLLTLLSAKGQEHRAAGFGARVAELPAKVLMPVH